MELIACLACLKIDSNIYFYVSTDIQTPKLKRPRSDYQNGIIKYIKNSKKAQYEALEIKNLEMTINKYETLTDKDLREVIGRLIYID
jgi:hypothetical protein